MRYMQLLTAIVALSATAAERPHVQLYVGGGIAFDGPNFWVALYDDGSLTVKKTELPIVPPGKLSESTRNFQLSQAEATSIISLAEAAEDFAIGCERHVADGTSAFLQIQRGDEAVKHECLNVAQWPKGVKTKRFLKQLNSYLPPNFQVQ